VTSTPLFRTYSLVASRAGELLLHVAHEELVRHELVTFHECKTDEDDGPLKYPERLDVKEEKVRYSEEAGGTDITGMGRGIPSRHE